MALWTWLVCELVLPGWTLASVSLFNVVGFQMPAILNLDSNLLQKGEVALPTAESPPRPQSLSHGEDVGSLSLFPAMAHIC